MLENTSAWHFNVLSSFRQRLFGKSFGQANITKEIVVKSKPYLLFQQMHKKYLLEYEAEDKLPIEIVESKVMKSRSDIFHKITKYNVLDIKPRKDMEFDEFTDIFAPFKHTKDKDWLLFKLLVLTAYLTRINARVATPPAFGKNSLLQILGELRQNCVVFQPRTMPAVEYRLGNKIVALDELASIAPDNRATFRSFLHLAGDFRNVYEKPARATKRTRDVYDISNLSLFLFYNRVKDYQDTTDVQESYFDFMFDAAIHNRYLPLKFEGNLYMGQFDKMAGPDDVIEVVDQEFDDLKTFTLNLEYYRNNWHTELKKRKRYTFEFPKMLEGQRQHTTFSRLSRIVNLYTDDKELYQNLIGSFWERCADYHRMIDRHEQGAQLGLAVDQYGKYDWTPEMVDLVK